MEHVTRRDVVKMAAAGVVATTAQAAVGAQERPAAARVAADAERGSSKMLEEMLGRPATLEANDLREMVRELSKLGKWVDWHQKGQPVPDSVWASFHTDVKSAGDVLRAVLARGRLRPVLEIFPLGIPFPEELRVELRMGGVGRTA